MKILTIQDYPFYKLKLSNDKETLIKQARKMAVYWEKLTSRNMDTSLDRLRSETMAGIKKLAKWNTTEDAAKIWLQWKTKKVPKTKASKKRSKRTSKSKKTSKKRSKHTSHKRKSKKSTSIKKNIKKTSKHKSKKKSIPSHKTPSQNKRSPKPLKYNRPSPAVSATEHSVGTVKTGNDGNKYVVIRTSNGNKRWIKKSN